MSTVGVVKATIGENFDIGQSFGTSKFITASKCNTCFIIREFMY